MASRPLDQLSPAYRRRIERAMAQGKTRQESRGHRPGEARERAERERAEEGISSNERRSIEAFASRAENQHIDEEDLLDYARSNGYAKFQQYRATLAALRLSYRQESHGDKYASRGTEFLDDMGDDLDLPDTTWLYYH